MEQHNPTSIFISHSSPSDNYFTAWLSSKLKLLGYKVWVELDELKSGNAFWPEIETAIRQQSIKFLTVISNTYMDKIKDPNSGVFKELSCADRIKNIKNFKAPIRIDPINEDDFPVQLMGLNAIDFHHNWQAGLDKLLESFNKEQIPKDQSMTDDPLNFWLQSFHIESAVTNASETLYTNWFPFELPSKLYIHKPVVANKIDLIDIPYSYLNYSDRHLCFFKKEDYPSTIACHLSTVLDIADIIQKDAVPVDDFLTLTEPRKKIVQLLNKTVEDFFIQAKMKKHAQANTNVYYFPNIESNRKRISLKQIGKTNVAVTGKNGKNFWSFGISSYAILYPSPYIKLNSHIIFENSEQVVFDPEEHHALRRKFAFDWYNKDWLDTLLGMSLKLANHNTENKILIPISNDTYLSIDAIPFTMETDFGYQEPVNLEKDEE